MSDQYTITEQYHEKKGSYIYVIRLIKKVDKDEFTNLCEYAKDYDGYYSSYRGVNGFVFQTKEDAELFGTILDTYFGTSNIDNRFSVENEESVLEKALNLKETKRLRIKYTPAESKVKSEPVQMTSGLPLHMALRNVIQSDSEDIIKDVKLVNILDDFHVYNDFPVAKYILRSIIADGYSRKLHSIGCWNNEALQLVSKFVATTGFIPEHVNRIFQSLAYGLGWINVITCIESDSIESQKTNAKQTKKNKPNSNKSTTGLHLEFKGIEICGNPKAFVRKLKALGYSEWYWNDDSAVVQGTFAGSSNCDIYINFYPKEKIVYSVWVYFQEFKNRKRVFNDYKKLKSSLKKIYGLPECGTEDEDDDVSWVSKFITPKGTIELHALFGQRVYIKYIDGYYDSHNAAIDEKEALSDL